MATNTTRPTQTAVRFEPVVRQMTVMFGKERDGPARRRAIAGPASFGSLEPWRQEK